MGEAIGRSATAAGLVVAFRGDLGAGKTVMAKGAARGLGITDEVTSPTFTIISEYSGRLRLHHVDAWRLGGWTDFQEIGGEDILDDPGALCLIEWSERLAGDLPRETEVVELVVEADGRRRARITGPRLEAIARAFLEASPGGAP